MKNFTGTGVALITPFKSDKSVDFDALKNLIEHTIPYVDYFVVNGTTAESPTLTGKEKQEILDFVIQHNSKNLPIMFGLGGYNTYGLIDIFNSMDMSGVDAILSVSPQYVKPSQKGIVEHFKVLADRFTKPILLYNVPSRTGSNMSAETTLELAKHPNIFGIKEASGDLEQCMKIAQGKPKDFLLISGDDLMTVPISSVGGSGVISVIANALPKAFSNVVNQALNEHYETAHTEMGKMIEITQLLFAEGNPVGVKLACNLLNICSPNVRLPLVEGSSELKEKIQKQLKFLTIL